MRVVPSTILPGVIVIEPDVHEDGRGFFLETYHADRYREHGIAGAVRPGQPFAIDRRHAARPASAAPAAAGEADPGDRRRDFRRRRRRPPRVADVRPMGRRRPVGRELQAVLTSRPASLTDSASSARSRRSNTSARTSTTRRARSASPGTTRRSASPGRSREPLLSPRDSRHAAPLDARRSGPSYQNL